MSLQDEDDAAGKVATAPRVTLESLKDKIAARYDLIAARAVEGGGGPTDTRLETITLCLLVMSNGFTVVGMSAPASSKNFDAPLGRTIAFENAIRQLWPLEGYQLRTRLMIEAHEAATPSGEPVQGDVPTGAPPA